MLKVTVAIPVYNREEMILGTMRSALEQRLAPGQELELLVIDNHSTDGTWNVIQSVQDSRVRAVRNDRNLGMFGNFNRCRELATGDYIRYLCSDDFLAKDCLAQEIELMEREPRASVLNTLGFMVDEQGNKIAEIGNFFEAGKIPRQQAMEESLVQLAQSGRNVFNFPSGVLTRKSASNQVEGFDASLLGLADFEYWMKLLQVGDLLVTKSVGCHVVEHGRRESYALFYSGDYIRGQIRVVDEWGARLKTPSSRLEAAKKALGARCLWYVLKCAAKGRFDGARIHWSIFRSKKYSVINSLVGIVKEIARRL